MPCLALLCLATLAVQEQLVHVGFVQGVSCRSSQQGQQEADPEVEARRLTSVITIANSAEKLMKILNLAMDEPIFNFIHASAAYAQLVTLKRWKLLRKRDWDSPVLLRLHTRVENMILNDQWNPQASANVLWSITQLSDRFSIPSQLLAALVKSVPTKVKDMNAQGISKIFWASAKAKDVAPVMLEMVPSIVAQIPKRAKDMGAQALSNCLFACALLKDEVPKVLDSLPAVVGEIPAKFKNMTPQEMSNSLEALVLLHDSIPDEGSGSWTDDSLENIVRCAARRFKRLLPRLRGKDFTIAVPVAIWACARLRLYDEEFLASVAEHFTMFFAAAHFGSYEQQVSTRLPNFSLCALSWSYQVFSAQDDFHGFDKLLMSEVRERGFNEADVQSCQRGHLRWNHAKL